MNEILDEIINRRAAEIVAEAAKERVQKAKRETAVRLLKMGLSPEQAAEGSALPLDEVNKLHQGKSA